MNILVGIATYNRPRKLIRLLKSLANQTHQGFDVHIAFDNNDYESRSQCIDWVIDNALFAFGSHVMPQQSFVIGCWNSIYRMHMCRDVRPAAFLMLCDDVELHPNCLEEAMLAAEMIARGSDFVVGISQECPGKPDYTYKPYGQVLIGIDFVRRYATAGYWVCCPAYTHWYQDQEMWEFAGSINANIHSLAAKLKHYHPSFLREELDSTHHIARDGVIQQRDELTFKTRQANGLLWGKSFIL